MKRNVISNNSNLFLIIIIVGLSLNVIYSLKRAERIHHKSHINKLTNPITKNYMEKKIPIICILSLITKIDEINIIQKSNDGNSTIITPALNFTSKIDSSYINWIISGGAVPSPLHWKNKKLKEKLIKCNGVVLQNKNGEIDLNSDYEKSVKEVYTLIKEINDERTFLPLLAIGSSSDLIQIIESNNTNILFDYSSYNSSDLIPLELIISDVKRIRMVHYFDGRDINNLKNNNSTSHYNSFGVSPDAYLKTPALKNMFKVIGLGSRNSKIKNKFVSMFEAYKYPIYGIEFDPAKYIYDKFNEDTLLEYSNEAITISQKILNFFIKESLNNLIKKITDDENNKKTNQKSLKSIDIYSTMPIREKDSIGRIVYNYIFRYIETISSLPVIEENHKNSELISNNNTLSSNNTNIPLDRPTVDSTENAEITISQKKNKKKKNNKAIKEESKRKENEKEDNKFLYMRYNTNMPYY